jgi:hypothetical protein
VFVGEESANAGPAGDAESGESETTLLVLISMGVRVDRSSKNPIAVDGVLCAGQAGRIQPEADMESLRFL